MPLSNKLAAEFVGTFWLVLGGCGSAVLAAAFPALGIGFAGVALAFGLTVLTMAYAIGHNHQLGGYFNRRDTIHCVQPAECPSWRYYSQYIIDHVVPVYRSAALSLL